MSPQDAAKVLAVFASAFRHDVDEQAMQIWYQSCLSHITAEVAGRVAERIVAEDEWFPTVARFNAVRRAVERGMEEPHRALPSPTLDVSERDRIKQIITDTRDRLKGRAS